MLEIAADAVARGQLHRIAAADRADALAAAEPHWQRAESERAAALVLGKQIRETEQAVSAASNGDKAALQSQLRDLKAKQQAHEAAAKCLASGKKEDVCMAELQASCKGLAIGKYCGMKHGH